ncbi:MAG: hypothetical protein OHK0039_03370 [Bacteroidia bacterium]
MMTLLVLLSCKGGSTGSVQAPVADSLAYSIRLIEGTEGGYGYEIVQAARPLLRQPFVPTLPGRMGFADSAQARRCAALVVAKLEAGVFPPTLSAEEVQGVLGDQR